MRINHLKLVNWRNHADTDITLDRLTCIRGGNTAGKSSIGQAIEYGLTGRCDATDEKGAGATGLIRQGADKAAILLNIAANREVLLKCTLTPASGRTVHIVDPNDATWNGAAVKRWLDSQRRVLSCLLNSRYFIGLKAAEQKSLLASIILPENYDWPKHITDAALQSHLSINFDQAPFDVIEAAYKAAFDRRRDVNRDLKNLQIPDAIAAPENAVPAEELSRMRARIYEIEKERRAQASARSQHLAKVAGVEQRVETLRAKLRTEQETLSHAEQCLLSKAKARELQKIAANEKKAAELTRDIDILREGATSIRGIMSVFEGLKGKQCCPLCQRDVTEEWLAEAYEPHNQRLKDNLDKQEQLLDALKALGDVAGVKRQLEDDKRYNENAARSKGIISETQNTLRNAEQELEELRGATPAEPTDDDAEFRTLREKIAAAEASVEAAAVADARAREIARLTKQQEQLKAAQQTLDNLVQYFGPEGVKAEMLKEHIGGFTEKLNAGLAAWGYAAEFQIEPYGFTVANLTTGAKLALELLSGSERLRFAIAFQVALAQVSDIRLVVIDEADILDSEGRSAFYPLLLAADIDQAITIGTDEREEVPEVEGAVFYTMNAGKAARLEPVGA